MAENSEPKLEPSLDMKSVSKIEHQESREDATVVMYGRQGIKSIFELKSAGKEPPPSSSLVIDTTGSAKPENMEGTTMINNKKSVSNKEEKKTSADNVEPDKKKRLGLREQVSRFIADNRILKFMSRKNKDKKGGPSNETATATTVPPSSSKSKRILPQPSSSTGNDVKNTFKIVSTLENTKVAEREEKNGKMSELSDTTNDSFQQEEEEAKFQDTNLDNEGQEERMSAAWGDMFSLRTVRTEASSSRSEADDNISVKTTDIYKEDDEVQDFPERISSDDDLSTVYITASVQTVQTTKRKIKVQAKQSRVGHFIHSHVINKNSFPKIKWENSFEAITVKNCAYRVTTGHLRNSQYILTNLKFAKLTSFKNVLTFLTTCPNITRLSFSNVTMVQKGIYTEGSFETLALPHLKELEVVNWLLCLTKNEYWLLNFFTKAVTLGNVETFILRGTEGMLTENRAKRCRKLMQEIRTDPSIVSKFLLKNHGTLKSASLGGLGFSLTQSPVDMPKLQLTSLRLSLSSDGMMQTILKNQKKLKELTCSGFLDDDHRVDERLKSCITTTIENNLPTLTSFGFFPCLVREANNVNVNVTTNVTTSHVSPGYSFNCDVFQRCKKLDSVFINVTMASEIYGQRKSCGRLLNIHLLPLTLVQIQLYNQEFNLHELSLLGSRLPKFSQLKRLVLCANSVRLYTIFLQWIKNLLDLPFFLTADFFGGKLENAESFRHYITKQPKGSITMTKISDCVSFTRSPPDSGDPDRDRDGGGSGVREDDL